MNNTNDRAEAATFRNLRWGIRWPQTNASNLHMSCLEFHGQLAMVASGCSPVRLFQPLLYGDRSPDSLELGLRR